MKQFEYKRIERRMGEDMITILNNEGKDGWQAVQITDGWSVVLMREKPEGEQK